MSQDILKKLEEAPNRKINIIANISVVIVLIAWAISGLNTAGVGENGFLIVKNIFKGIFQPDFRLFNLTTNGIPYLIVETLAIAFLGTMLGAILSLPFAFLSSPNIVSKPLAYVFRVFLVIIRTVPTVIYGLIFIRVVGPGPFAGVLTMGVTSIAMIAKLMSEAIQDVNGSVIESLSALGLTNIQKIRYGVIPQVFAIYLSTIIYRFDINLRDATVLGLVGAGGIGAPLLFAINGYKWNQAGAILMSLVVLVLVIEFLSSKLRNRIIKGY